MRVILASDTYFPNVNGASIFTQRLAKKLKERGHDVLVIAPSQNFKRELSFHEGIPVYGLRSIPAIWYKGLSFSLSLPIGQYENYRFSPSLRENNDLKRIISQFEPDVVHIQNHVFIGRAVAKVAQKLGIAVVATNHFMPDNILVHAQLPEKLEKLAERLAWKDFIRVYEKADIVTTPTHRAADVLARIGFNKPVQAISCGIDLHRFNPHKHSLEIRHKYSLPDTPLLLFVGRLEPEKNIDHAIKALRQVDPEVSIHFVIAGNGNLKKELQALTNELHISERVTLLGYVPDEDLPALYASVYAFIMPGTAELQSIVTMEAMASGLPVIAADAVALPELVHHEQNGFLFAPEDISALTANISKLFTSPSLRDTMSHQSLTLIQTHDINKTVATYEDVYQSVRTS